MPGAIAGVHMSGSRRGGVPEPRQGQDGVGF